MRVLITGSSGLIGTAVSQELRRLGHEVIPLLRAAAVSAKSPCPLPLAVWDLERQTIDLRSAGRIDAVVHLAGENVGSRWTRRKKVLIRSSRVDATRLLARALTEHQSRPAVLVSASATGYYGSRGAEVLTEASASGRGFLAGVCQAWEAATAPLEEAGTQVAHLRTGIVLASHGGALAKMLPIFRAGLGGPVGDGCQFWSWITLSDVVRVVIFLLGQADVHGAVNNVSPNPVTNREFTKALAAAVRRPAFMPLPAIVAKLMLGEMADETLLSSARVQPERLLAAGFQFEHRTIHDALKSLMPT